MTSQPPTRVSYSASKAPGVWRPKGPCFFGRTSTVASSIYAIATLKEHFVLTMIFRAAAVAVAALAALDWYFLNGEYLGAVEAMARSLIHFVVG
jgi:hypothetical protein